jgi:hypothetical protein
MQREICSRGWAQRTGGRELGSIGAEAKGIVRRELAKLEECVPIKLGNLFDEADESFNCGRRLTAKQAEAFLDRATGLIGGQAVGDLSRIYAWALPFEYKPTNGEDFEESVLELRSMKLNVSRRRLCFLDSGLGLYFTFHSLGRIVERAGVREGLVPHVLRGVLELLPALALIVNRPAFAPRMTLPFADGIVIVEPVRGVSVLLEYENDARGSGFPRKEGIGALHEIDDGAAKIAYRVKTYLSWDTLSGSHEEVLASWNVFLRDWSDVLDQVLAEYLALETPIREPVDDARMEEALSALSSIFRSEAWKALLPEAITI